MNSKRKFTILDILVIIFSLFTLISLTYELLFKVNEEVSNLIGTIDIVSSVVFLCDWIKGFRESGNKIKYAIMNLPDLIASFPYSIIGSFQAVRYAKIIRLTRILKVFRAFKSAKSLLFYLKEDNKYSMKMMFVCILSIMIVVGSSSILIAESSCPESNIKTSEEALWWSFVTLATVGYGDYYPVTTEGRLIAVVMSLGGIGLFGAFTGTLMTYFIKDEKNKDNSQE